MSKYSQLEAVVMGKETNIGNAPPDLAREVQELLRIKGFYKGEIDGVPGENTLKAFAEFKANVFLAHPETLGATTAASLLEIAEEHKVSEQGKPLPLANPGASMRLPTGKRVYASDLILPGGNHLSWGEVTANCSRIPEDNTIEGNLLITARGFQEIRDKYGSPLQVTSGYRPQAVNRAIGGARLSQHINGLAVDILPSDGDLTRLLNVILNTSVVGVGDGRHRGFIHADWRRNSPRTVFYY